MRRSGHGNGWGPNSPDSACAAWGPRPRPTRTCLHPFDCRARGGRYSLSMMRTTYLRPVPILPVLLVMLTVVGCSASPTTTVTVTVATAQPPKPEPRAEVVAAFPRSARGERLRLTVEEVTSKDVRKVDPCTYHLFGEASIYADQCAELTEASGKQLYIFQVVLRNDSESSVEFDVEHFLLVDADGSSVDPVDVRSDFDYPPWLFPPSGLIPPAATRSAYLAFDGRLEGLVARSLSYVDGEQTLTVTFAGDYRKARF